MKKIILLIASISFIVINASSQQYNNVTAPEFSELIKSGNGIILDVRTPGEFSRGHIENATLISTNDREFAQKISLLQKDKEIYVYCLTGSRSRAVASYLVKNGFTKVYNLNYGIADWQRNGYKTIAGENPVASNSKTYNETEFKNILTKNSLVLADFHAVWCAPCKKMSPVIEKINTQYANKLTVEKIDIESNKLLQTNYNVQAVPGLVLFKNGKEVWRYTGYISYEELSKIVNKHI